MVAVQRPIPERALETAVRALARGFSIEVVPREAQRIADFGALLPAGTRVYIAAVPGVSRRSVVDAAARLQRQRMVPVPHLAARELGDADTADACVGALVEHAGVEEVLVIGGDRPSPAGHFADAVGLLRTGILEARGIRRAGIGAHPEGHPYADDAALERALDEKMAWAETSPVRCHVVTQFCFEPEPVLAWLRRWRARGLHLPVRVGVPGLASAATLIRYGRSCGAGASLRALTRHYRSALRLASVVSPAHTVTALAAACEAEPGLGVEGLHFYPFGAFARTAAWAHALADGRFRVHEGALAFER